MEEFLRRAYILGIVAVFFMFTAAINPAFTGFTASNVTAATSNLTIWDQSDPEGGSMTTRTYPQSYVDYGAPGGCPFKDESQWNVSFKANYTNTTNDPIDDTAGICQIRLNKTGTWTSWDNMTYNLSSGLWTYNASFTYKGSRDWEVNCSSAGYSDILLADTNGVSIVNTRPCIFADDEASGYLPSMSCDEDTVCTYDMSQNTTDDDQNDVLTYTCASGCFSNFSIDSGTGIWTVNITDMVNPTEYTITIQVNDTAEANEITSQNITVDPSNDEPVLSTLPSEVTEDVEFNLTTNPEGNITATDEEDNTPFRFNVTFLSCQKAHWIEYPTDNCSVFNFTLSNDNITIEDFTPTNWDVGTYEINFSVEDSGAEYPQFSVNATAYSVVWFNVTNVNDAPVITPINSTEIVVDQGDTLYLVYNGTDIENDTVVFNSTTMIWNESNQSYFIFSNSSLFPIQTNSTHYPNESAYGIVNITLGNDHVGNYTLNITLTDNGTNPENITAYIYVNLSVLNVNDPPELAGIPATLPYAVQELPYTYYYNATDPDFGTIYGETLTFGMNLTFCETPNGTECDLDANSTFSVTKAGPSRARLYIYAVKNDTGNYTLNLTVNDSAGNLNYTIVNISIVTDSAPVFDAISYLSGTQKQPLFYGFNVTDAEGDSLNMTNVTLFRNLTQVDANLFPVSNDSSGYPPYMNLTMNYTNLANAQVGNYTLEINATDYWNRTTSHYINISIANINDPPAIYNFTSCDKTVEYGLNMTLYENVNYCIVLYRPDPDLYVPADTYVEDLTYTTVPIGCTSDTDYSPSGNCSGFSTITIDYDDGDISFTAPNETWHGNYTYNITVTDKQGLMAYKLFNISLMPVNDAPVLQNTTDFLNLSAEDDFIYQINATDEEDNYPFFYNVSFTCDGSPCTLFTINNTTGLVDYTLQLGDVGDYTANFTVTDAGNLTFGFSNSTGWYITDITVNMVYHPPVISLLSVSSFDMLEGSIKDIFYRASDTIDNDTLTCYWYNNGTLIQPDTTLSQQVENSISNCNTTVSSALWQYPVTYDDALNLTLTTANITLVVVDEQGMTDSASLMMNVNGSNRAPRLNRTFQSPIQWYTGTAITPFNLNDYFIDDYGEVLDYSYDAGGYVSVGIDSGGDVTLTPQAGWIGTSWAVFHADDTPYNASSTYNASSNNITLAVLYQEPERVRVPRTVHTPRVASLQIIVDEIIRVPGGNESTAKVKFHNDGTYTLYELNLSATINETNITLELADNFIEKLDTDGNFTTVMTITLGDLEEGEAYTGYVHADGTNPRIQERTAFTIMITPSNSTRIVIEMVLIKDLFEENPECMELFGLIVEAESALDMGDMARARELTQLAMDNCQDMIDYAKIHGNQTISPSMAIAGQIFMNPFFVMGFVIALIALAMIGYWFMSKRFTAETRSKRLVAEEK